MFDLIRKNIFVSILELLEVPHTRRYSSKYYHEHPNKNNLLGLSSMLSYYGIKNTGVKLTNKTDIIHVKCPFIAHLDDGFALVVSINEKYASYIEDNSLKNKRVSIDSFKRSWTGNLLLVEPQTNSQEPGFRNHRNEEYLRNGKTILFFLSIAFVLIEFTYHNIIKASSKFSFCVLLFSIVGTSICMLLVNKKINRGLTDRFCSLSNTMNCNKVLDSKIFNISGFIDLTDIGLGFFISNIVIVCVFPVFTKYLVVINLLGFPFTIWSIWYQKFKVKEWCPLCLSVIFTLWGIYYSAFAFNKWIGIGAFYFIDFLLTGSIFIIIILGISYLTSIFQDSKDLVKATYEIKQIKFNESVFWTLLYKQDYYPESELHSHILISNTQSDHSITILVNPHCTPCALMHQRIQSFLKKNPNISVRYIFSSFHENLDESRKFLIAAYLQNKTKYNKVYDEWFEFGRYNPKDFFSKHSVDIDDKKVFEEYNLHQKWILQSRLSTIPTVLFDGFKLPDNYSIEDLLHIEFESI